MTTLRNSLEGGTSGVTISAGNSGGASGDAFNTVGIGTGATLAYDNAHAAHGTLSMQVATGATSVTSTAPWTISATVAWFRAYVYVTSNPAANLNIIRLNDSATILTTIRLNSTGKIAFLTGSATLSGTSTTSFPLGQWFRIEMGVDFTTPGSQTVTIRLYLDADPDSTTITETLSASGLTVGSSTIGSVRFGVITAGTNIGPFWLDDVGFSDVTWLGPVFSGQGTAVATTTAAGSVGGLYAASGAVGVVAGSSGASGGLLAATGTDAAVTASAGTVTQRADVTPQVVTLTSTTTGGARSILLAAGTVDVVAGTTGDATRTPLLTAGLSTATVLVTGTATLLTPAAGTTSSATQVSGDAHRVAPGGPDLLGPMLSNVLGCAESSLSPRVGRSALYPGAQVAWDDCCDGQVWVRVMSMIPSGTPANSRNQTTPCGVIMWTVTLGVGTLRCAAVVDDQGNAPTPAALSEDTLQMTADMTALSGALQCCLAPQVSKLTMLRWDPLGPDGACVGGEWQVQILLDNCRCT